MVVNDPFTVTPDLTSASFLVSPGTSWHLHYSRLPVHPVEYVNAASGWWESTKSTALCRGTRVSPSPPHGEGRARPGERGVSNHEVGQCGAAYVCRRPSLPPSPLRLRRTSPDAPPKPWRRRALKMRAGASANASSGAVRKRRDVIGQAADRLLAALDRVIGPDDEVARLVGVEHHAQRQVGPVAARRERDGGLVRRRLGAGLGDVAIDQALGPDHLAEHDLAGVVAAVGAVHGETPHAAGPQIHLVDR